MSTTHEQLREDSKERINQLTENEDISQIEDEMDHIQHTLFYSRQPLTNEAKAQLMDRLHTLQNNINFINDNSDRIKDMKRNLANTMSTARLASLPSFQSKNSENVDKVLSDPHLLKHITSYNTGFGGSRRHKKHSRRNSRRNNRKTKNRRSKRSKRSSRRYRK
jgi:hypothetical protein